MKTVGSLRLGAFVPILPTAQIVYCFTMKLRIINIMLTFRIVFSMIQKKQHNKSIITYCAVFFEDQILS